MVDIHLLGKLLRQRGYDFFSGVPCSSLKDLINYSVNNFQYVIATNEGEAVAISAGAYLAGKKSCVLMQNSGLTNALNPLTSLNYCFEIPVLGFVSWRGEPSLHDEPEHTLMGKITDKLLDICGISHLLLSTDEEELRRQLEVADQYIERNESFFFIVKKGSFTEEKIEKTLSIDHYERQLITGSSSEPKPARLQVLEAISGHKDKDTLLLAATGKTGRELFEIEDAPNNLYMVGSMGCVSSIGLGIALARQDKRVVAIDGDGALLMRMGSMATNGFYRPRNMLHILLDNESHDSTGGQQTVSANVLFAEIAKASGYRRSVITNSIDEIGSHIEQWKANPVLTFLHIKIEKGSKKNLGRPTVKPFEVKKRIMAFMDGSGA